MKVVILHDNPSWFRPLQEAFAEYNVDTEEWITDERHVDMTEAPCSDLIFYNRASASSHVRDHRYSLESARAICRWAQEHDRVVINGLAAVDLEESKSWQYIQAQKYGIPVPKTIMTAQVKASIIETHFGKRVPFVLKPDRGGRGVFVSKYENLEDFINDTGTERFSPNGLFLIQEYLHTTRGVYRAEFVGQEFLYVSRTNIPSTSFSPNMCPCELPVERYRIQTDFQHPILDKFRNFMVGTGIENCAFEFIYGDDGLPYVYDINTNTAFNEEAEKEAGVKEGGFEATVRYVVNRLRAEQAKIEDNVKNIQDN